MIKIITFLYFVVFLFTENVNAKVTTKTSTKMYQNCKMWIKQNNGEKLAAVDLVKGLSCSWYFRGMFDSSALIEVIDDMKTGKRSRQARLNGVCVPSSMSPGQWVRVFVKYLDDNPQYLNRNASINSAAALKKYYKCIN